MNKIKKRSLSVLLSLMLIVSLFAGLGTTASAASGNWSDYADTSWYTTTPSATSYTISSAAELAGLAEIVNGNFPVSTEDSFINKTITLAANGTFDLSDHYWTPIGAPTITSDAATGSPVAAGSVFSGTFNGNDMTVEGLTINGIESGAGLFGYVGPKGTVQDLTVSGSVSVSGSVDAVAGVVGYNSGIIGKVTSNVTVSAGSAFNVGGIAGFNDNYYTTGAVGTIRNSANYGNVEGYQKVGGITGENSGVIDSCSNHGDINATRTGKGGAGGIAGRNGNGDAPAEIGEISNCYNTGDITAIIPGDSGSWVGGIAGFQSAGCTISNTYNIGNFDGYGFLDHTVGRNEGTLTNHYGLDTVTGAENYDDTILMDAADMQASAFIDDLNGSPSSERWSTSLSPSVNDGYPTLANNSTIAGAPAAGGGGSGNVVYLGGSTPGAYTNLSDALDAAGPGGTVLVADTITISAAMTRNDSATVKRAAGFAGAMFIIDTPNSADLVRFTTMTFDGEGGNRIFLVMKGTLQLRGNVTLTDCVNAIGANPEGIVEVNYATIESSGLSFKMAPGSQLILDSFGFQPITITGAIYLPDGSYISVANTLTGAVTVQMENPAVNQVVAQRTGTYVFTPNDLAMFTYDGGGHTFKLVRTGYPSAHTQIQIAS